MPFGAKPRVPGLVSYTDNQMTLDTQSRLSVTLFVSLGHLSTGKSVSEIMHAARRMTSTCSVIMHKNAKPSNKNLVYDSVDIIYILPRCEKEWCQSSNPGVGIEYANAPIVLPLCTCLLTAILLPSLRTYFHYFVPRIIHSKHLAGGNHHDFHGYLCAV